jgi:hypothetical protein
MQIKKAASHLANVSIQGEPSVAVLVDETVEEVFQEAVASLELDIQGRFVVEQSSLIGMTTWTLESNLLTLFQILYLSKYLLGIVLSRMSYEGYLRLMMKVGTCYPFSYSPNIFPTIENATHIAQVISIFFKAFNIISSGITRLAAPHLETAIHLPEFSFSIVQDNK